MTRLSRIVLGVVFLLGLGAVLCAADPMPLTLEQAIASAEGVNLSVLLGREAAVQAQEAANQARVNVLPNIAASAQQRRTRSLTILSTSGALSETRPSNRFDG